MCPRGVLFEWRVEGDNESTSARQGRILWGFVFCGRRFRGVVGRWGSHEKMQALGGQEMPVVREWQWMVE